MLRCRCLWSPPHKVVAASVGGTARAALTSSEPGVAAAMLARLVCRSLSAVQAALHLLRKQAAHRLVLGMLWRQHALQALRDGALPGSGPLQLSAEQLPSEALILGGCR